MKTIKLSEYGAILTKNEIDSVNGEMNKGVITGEPVVLDFKDVKGIDSPAAQKLMMHVAQQKVVKVQMKNASPMVKRFVWEKAYLADCSQIVREEVREEIKKFYKKYDRIRELDFSFEAVAVAA